jgi:hypothetical protein
MSSLNKYFKLFKMKKSILTFLTFCTTTAAFSQVVYTELTTPITINSTYAGEGYNVDFNNDLTPELTIYANKADTVIGGFIPAVITGIAVNTYGNTFIAGTTQLLGTETLLVADSINNVETIGATQNYINSATPAFYPSVGLSVDAAQPSGTAITNVGKFRGVGYKYVGVRFEISGATHYGWIRVSCTTGSTSGTIHSYAYETTPNTSIIAGDMGAGGVLSINEVEIGANLYAADNKLYVTSTEEVSYEIVAMSGAVIAQKSVNGNSVIDLNELASGIYVINYSTIKGTHSFKFVKG